MAWTAVFQYEGNFPSWEEGKRRIIFEGNLWQYPNFIRLENIFLRKYEINVHLIITSVLFDDLFDAWGIKFWTRGGKGNPSEKWKCLKGQAPLTGSPRTPRQWSLCECEVACREPWPSLTFPLFSQTLGVIVPCSIISHAKPSAAVRVDNGTVGGSRRLSVPRNTTPSHPSDAFFKWYLFDFLVTKRTFSDRRWVKFEFKIKSEHLGFMKTAD